MELKIGAAYIRASTDDQLEYSPESQIKKVQEYAKREGYLIPDEYIFQDDGISGKTADKRPAFRLMIGMAKSDNPPFDCIFVWEFSRFARNQEESIMYKNLLRKKGITVKSVREPLADSPFASLIERIIEWMDEYYLINLSIEVRRGMTEKATRGEAMGTAPFGYTVKDKTFVPNENADLVRYIFAEYLSGKGHRTIAAELGEKGVRTRRGNPPDNRWVKYILSNPAYIGKIRWSTEGHANYTRADFNGDNVMISVGKHEPIIDLETWEAVQKKLSQRDTEAKYVRRANPRSYLLKGLVRCSSCGATLIMQSAKTPTLQCHNYAKGLCRTSHSITISKANVAILESLKNIAETQSYAFTPQQAEKPKITHDWDKLISSEENKLRRARAALLDGVFDPAEYREVKDEVESNIEKLRAAKESEAAAYIPEIPDKEAFTKKVLDVLKILEAPDLDEQTKNEALRSIVDKIVFNKASSAFDFYFAP